MSRIFCKERLLLFRRVLAPLILSLALGLTGYACWPRVNHDFKNHGDMIPDYPDDSWKIGGIQRALLPDQKAARSDLKRVSRVLTESPPSYDSLTSALQSTDLGSLRALLFSEEYWRLWPSAIAAVSYLGSRNGGEDASGILQEFVLDVDSLKYVEKKYIYDALLLKTIAVFRLGFVPSDESIFFLDRLMQRSVASEIASGWSSWIRPDSDLSVDDYASILQGRAHSALLIMERDGQYEASLKELEKCRKLLEDDMLSGTKRTNGITEKCRNSVVLLRDELCDGLAARELINDIGMERYKILFGNELLYLNTIRSYIRNIIE